MRVPDVPGATGYIDTNFEGKAQAAIDEIENGQDFVYIHIEAPDECGHRAELQNKIRAIELIDQKILGPILNAFQGKEPFQIMVLPDHATPIAEKTHTAGPVPYLLYSSVRQQSNALVCFDEKNAAETGRFKEPGHLLLEQFLQY